jgi:hypothetical protein
MKASRIVRIREFRAGRSEAYSESFETERRVGWQK